MFTMSNNIEKDREWLKEQVEEGVEAFIETEHEYLVGILTRYVCRQLYIAGCAINSENLTDEPVKLQIVIDIPAPDQCVDAIDNIGRRSVIMDG